MIALKYEEPGVPTISVSGLLQHSDYEQIVPELEKLLEHGKARILVELNEFKGFTPAALVDELKFEIRHRKDFDRIAVVSDSKVSELGVRLVKPFFDGEVKIFDKEERRAAVRWIQES
jgi:hypothetical protein